jgi:DNA-binding SARP family transcriptional activator
MAEIAFRVLGSLDLLIDDRPVPINSARQRIILAVLLMAPDHVVTVDRLIDAVWDDDPPATARAQIQICISALRRAMGQPNLIDTSPSGYRIRVQRDQLDYAMFDSAVVRGRAVAAQGDLDAAFKCLDRALQLWRGPALAGVPGRTAESLARSLEERRIMAKEDLIEIRLGLGGHRELIQELVTLTGQYPLREHLYGFLMIALYRSGRQADALAVYRSVRQILAEELGIEPSRHLRHLERAILSHESSLEIDGDAKPAPGAAADRPPRQLPADISHFVGHADLLEGLVTVLTRPPAPHLERGHIPKVVVTGPPGCGKSAIALRAAHLAREQFPDGQLFADLHGDAAQPTATMEVMARFLRALGVAAHTVPVDEDERTNLLRSQLASRRILIVLDDAADEEQIVRLLPGVPGPAVLITSRSKLSALPGAHLVEIGAMSGPDGVGLLERIVGPERITAEYGAAADLARLCGELPLALRIAGVRLAAQPQWAVGTLVGRLADEWSRLGELAPSDIGVRSVLALVHASLGESAQELFRLLSVPQMHDFTALVAAALLDSDPDEAARVLDELADAHLLELTAPAPGQLARYRFHDLVRAFARECMAEHPPHDGVQAAERVLGCLLAVADEAHLRLYEGDPAVVRGKGPRWLGAQPHFDRLLREPMAWFAAEHENLQAAVFQAVSLGMHELAWELAVISVAAYEALGLFDEWRSTHTAALEATRRAGNTRGQAAVMTLLGSLGLVQHSEGDADMQFRALSLFEEIGDEVGKALALRNLSAQRVINAMRAMR